MKSICIAAAMVFLCVSGASAADGDGGEKPKKEKKICRTEKVTGSLTRVNRICMTQAEWDRLNRETKKSIDDYTSGAAGSKRCSNDPMGAC